MGAHFQHQRANEGGRAADNSSGNGDVFVGVGHVNLATTHDALKSGPEDTQKQPGAHAGGGKQQRGKKHSHRGSEDDGDCRSLRRGDVAGHLLLGYIMTAGTS